MVTIVITTSFCANVVLRIKQYYVQKKLKFTVLQASSSRLNLNSFHFCLQKSQCHQFHQRRQKSEVERAKMVSFCLNCPLHPCTKFNLPQDLVSHTL